MKKNFADLSGKFQYIAGAMMNPIIILVICGLFMGFFSPLTNFILEPGTILYTVAFMFTRVASMIMGNLALWFVIGITFGLTHENKGWAVFTAVFLFMGVNTVIGANAGLNGITAANVNDLEYLMTLGYTADSALVTSKLFSNVLGVFTYDMSIFNSLVCGAVTSVLMNKWGNIKLPSALAFFAGPKFIMLITPIFAVIIGLMLYYVWPIANTVISSLGAFIGQTGLFGTFIYGVADRALLPFGLHHLITMPLRYTELGGSMIIDGVLYEGTTNIGNALIGSPTATSYLIRNFTSGRILTNLGAWPGAALAMWQVAKPENRKKVLALLIPAVFTATFVGVTEPIEFTVLFANPLLYYLVHVPLSGVAFVLTELTQVSINGFAVMFMIQNILQPDKVQAMSLLVLVPVYFGLYYFIFKWAIVKFNIKTPGRGDDNSAKLVSKKEYQKSIGLTKNTESSETGSEEEVLAANIVDAFGGADNIVSVTNCLSRLRVKVVDPSLVAEKEYWTDALEATGVVVSKENFQIIYGPRVINIATNVKKEVETLRKQ